MNKQTLCISSVSNFLYTVGLSSRIDCCTNNNYPAHLHFSKRQLLNYGSSESSRSNTNTLSRRPSFTLQSPLQHRPIVENIISDNNNTYRQPDPFNFNHRRAAFSLRRSDSYSPGMYHTKFSKK